MQGSVRKKGDSWYYRIDLGKVDGKRTQIERYGGRRKQDADKALRNALKQLDQTGIYHEPSEMSYSDFLDEWLETCVKPERAEYTYKTYKSNIENHIKPAVGAYQLKQLSPMILQNFINGLKEKYSKSTIQLIMNIMRSSLSFAVQPYGYIISSPMQYVRLPTFEKEKNKVKIFSDVEMQSILQNFELGHVFYLPIRLSYRTGMRIGECLALRWQNVDLENKVIYVQHTLNDKSKGIRKLVPPKSKNSIRQLPFDDELLKAIKAYKAWQAANKLKYGAFYVPSDDFVCTQENGTPLISNDMRYFGMYCRKILQSDKSFHSLRHTHATALLENGATLEYVSKRLGHSSLSITADTYIHITERMNTQAIDILSNALVK